MDLEERITSAAARGSIVGTRRALEVASVAGIGPLLYSCAGAGEVLGCSASRVGELVDAGDLTCVKGPGRGRQIARVTLVAYVDKLVMMAERDRPLEVAS